MIVTLKPCTLVGIDVELVDVEGTIDRGLPQYSAVSLAAPSVKEGASAAIRARVMGAVAPTADGVSQVM